jgi:hypothetical protein
MVALQVPPDFIGLNCYHGYYARNGDENGWASSLWTSRARRAR